MDGILNTTRSSRDNSLDIDVPGNITATVSTVSTCDKVSDSQPSDGFIIIGESTNIPILVPDNQGLFELLVYVLTNIYRNKIVPYYSYDTSL